MEWGLNYACPCKSILHVDHSVRVGLTLDEEFERLKKMYQEHHEDHRRSVSGWWKRGTVTEYATNRDKLDAISEIVNGIFGRVPMNDPIYSDLMLIDSVCDVPLDD